MSISGTYNETKDNTYNEKEDQPNYREIRSEAGLETNNGTDKHNQDGHNSFTKPSDPSSAEIETFRKGGCSRGWLIGFGVITITFICIGVVVAVVVTSPGYGQRLALDGSTGLPSSTPSSTIGTSSSLENTTTILNESTSTIAYTTSLSASDDATSSQSEPVSTSLPNIVTTTVSEYETTTQSHSATTEQSSNATATQAESVTATQAESVTATQTRDVTVSQSENTTATQTQGVTASQTDHITATQREIVTATQKQGVTEKQTLNVTGASTESVTTQLQNKTKIDTTEIATTDVVAKSQTEGATTSQTENASTSQTEDATTSQTEGVTRSQTEDATPSQTEYVTKSQTEGITTTSTEDVTTSQTEDTTTQGVPLTTVAVTTPIDDGCEPIAFSECQSVGYSRTVFPSLWGDDSQDLAASSYDDFAADVVQRNCSVYSRYFFCSVFFAPCEDWEQLYPCRRVCDAVQRNCAPDLMQYLPCDFFEDDYPNCTLPLNWIELPVTSPPTNTDLTTAKSFTTEMNPDSCETITFSECRSVGYNSTVFPNLFDDWTQSAAIESYKSMPDVVNCSSYSQFFFCDILFPKCDRGVPFYPCQRVCDAVMQSCSLNFFNCSEYFNDDPEVCALPLNWIEATTDVTTSKPDITTDVELCDSIPFPTCASFGYDRTTLPNFFGSDSYDDALAWYEYYVDSLISDGCSGHLEAFFCSIAYVKCELGAQIYPCKRLCEDVKSSCPSAMLNDIDCSVFEDDPSTCYLPPTWSLPTTAIATTAKPPPVCEAITISICQNVLPYSQTGFPNLLKDVSQTAIESREITFFQGNYEDCHSSYWLFGCSVLLPQCTNTTIIQPCKRLCEEFEASCGGVLSTNIDCRRFINDDDPSICIPSPTKEEVTMPTNSCLEDELRCNNGYCVNVLRTCDGVDSCGDYSDELHCGETSPLDCDFEHGNTCGYTNDFGDILDWTLSSGSTPSVFTGPNYDNTYRNGSGHYIFLEATGRTFGEIAMMRSQEFTFQSPHCLRFSYHMRGREMGLLDVHLQNTSTNQHLWYNFGDRGDQWQQAFIDILSGTYSLVFIGSIGSSHEGDVAIDDITARVGTCPEQVCADGLVACKGVYKCISASQYCDTVNDCGDFQDEVNCSCNEFQYQCDSGLCIASYKRCDGVPQCPDNSDEANCTCPNGQHTCPDGECIMSEWLCDGEPDCSDDSDEANCPTCGPSKFTCQDGSCISLSERCDGVPQCPDTSDERLCVNYRNYNGMFEVLLETSLHPVCFLSWNDTYGNDVCSLIGEGYFISSERVQYAASQYLHLAESGTITTVIGKATLSNACPNEEAVSIKCASKGCGRARLHFISPRMIGGEIALEGEWPWQVSIRLGSTHFCGGSIINPNFILTAAHCVEKYEFSPQVLTVVAGTSKSQVAMMTQSDHKVTRIILNNHQYFHSNDIALLQLKTPISYTDYIQPICLPEPGDVFTPSSSCTTTGWGKQEWEDKQGSPDLMEAKMKLWQTSKCNSSLAWNGTIGETFLCAGYFSGLMGPCKGDSGGPLVCRDNADVWKLVGVTSYVASFCNLPAKPPVFTDVKLFLPFIASETNCTFTCNNGRCIFDRNQLCDRKDDCGDSSDEIVHCPVSVNCSFDDPFMCGYSSDGWEQQTRSRFSNQLPSYDHTQGSTSGLYTAAVSANNHLTSSTFTIYGTHCVRFFYHIWGQMSGYFNVGYIQKFSDGSRDQLHYILQYTNTNEDDEWNMATFDLNNGTYQLVIVTTEVNRVAIDDITVLPGSCSLGCLSDEFDCSLTATPDCKPAETRCNIVNNCPKTGEDERSCQASGYECSFENPLLCGLKQSIRDHYADWVFDTASVVDSKFTDHTTNNSTGHLVFVNTATLTRGAYARMTQQLHLTASEYCMTFYYRMNSSGTFRISQDSSILRMTTLWEVSNRQTASWSKAQFNITTGIAEVTLIYDVIGETFVLGDGDIVAIDDITISNSSCGIFECSADEFKCRDEDYCIPVANVCDRRSQCTDHSDETNCVCTESEFTCTTGACIAKSKECDGTNDCIDGSDEGTNCASLNSVSCDFEHPYMCGYSISGVGYVWTRLSGRTESQGTGPDYDHTLGSENNGHYIYTESSDGNLQDVTSLISPPMKTNVTNSMVFYYHMYGDTIGLLKVVAVDTIATNSTELLQLSGNKGAAWTQGCIELPSNGNFKILFEATKSISGYLGDIAVDDISVIDGKCPEIRTSSSSTTDSTGGCYFECSNGMCLARQFVCDGIPHCINHEDEFC